jgi:hypothetical protein
MAAPNQMALNREHLQDPDDEAAPLGDDGVQGNQVKEPGEVSGNTRYQRRGHRRVAKPSDDCRLLAGALVAPWRLPSPGPYTDGKPKRRQSPEQLDRRVQVGASVVDPRPVEDRHDENPDSHAECETGNEVRDKHRPGGRRAEQRVQSGNPGRARRACQSQHDDVQGSFEMTGKRQCASTMSRAIAPAQRNSAMVASEPYRNGRRARAQVQTAAPHERSSATDAAPDARCGRPGDLQGLPNGASRTRTGDLLGAIQALSQLSYSPEADPW